METEENCIFCKIGRGEIPAEVVYQDAHVVAFLDINPKAPGHTLVIPKAHYPWFYQLPDEESDFLFRAAKKIAQDLKEKNNADFVRLSIVGTDVPHVHVHLLPQKFADKKPQEI
jgi:histidine triad (HIT) family protein